MSEINNITKLFIVTKRNNEPKDIRRMVDYILNSEGSIECEFSGNDRTALIVNYPTEKMQSLEKHPAVSAVYTPEKKPSLRTLAAYGQDAKIAFAMYEKLLQANVENSPTEEEWKAIMGGLRKAPRGLY